MQRLGAESGSLKYKDHLIGWPHDWMCSDRGHSDWGARGMAAWRHGGKKAETFEMITEYHRHSCDDGGLEYSSLDGHTRIRWQIVWNQKTWPKHGRQNTLEEFIVDSVTAWCSGPDTTKQAQIIPLPPPCLTVGLSTFLDFPHNVSAFFEFLSSK